MTLFTSKKEKRLWILALSVTLLIFSTLFLGQPLVNVIQNQNVQGLIFVIGMLLVGSAILIHAFKNRPGKIEIGLWIGLVAVYIMFFLRLGLPERSHLIEYSVLAIIVHMALLERNNNIRGFSYPSLMALVLAFSVGLLDEIFQIFIPDRVFDKYDIAFNGIAVSMAIGARVLIQWFRKISHKKSS